MRLVSGGMAAFLSLALVACGDGGSSTPAPTPTPSPSGTPSPTPTPTPIAYTTSETALFQPPTGKTGRPINRGDHQAGDQGGDREGQVHERIQEPAAGKVIANKHDGGQGPEHRIDEGREQGGFNCQPEGGGSLGSADIGKKPGWSTGEGLLGDAQKRQQNQHEDVPKGRET